MVDFHLSASLVFSILIPLLFFVISKLKTSTSNPTKLPKSYPIFGSFFAILKNRERYAHWTSDIVTSTPNLTFTLHRPFGRRLVLTANAANVQHVLKSHFHNYDKGDFFRSTLRDFLGDGIFNTDGENWKFQRQVSSHEFNTKSLRKFLETVVDSELSDRLVPVLENAAAHETVLDFQDILQRFAFDNICKIAFGYDPGYLSESLPEEKLAVAFEKAVKLSGDRFSSFIPYFWKIKKALNIGSEKQLKIAVGQVREFAKEIIREKKQQLEGKSGLESSSVDSPVEILELRPL
ncbi:UNVERIFIED_CONTAM: cytochrome [Sesamum calycinum]|uniref:Cytochrome n=1 Tax=Sesamum calycinum TaxID=2727403 RepID=A0AAW2PR91_9LAMI